MSRSEKPAARNLIASLVKNHIAPVLSSHGFRRTRLVWNRRLLCVVHVLDIQTSRWHGDKTAVFTMNLGIWIEQLWRISWDKPVPTTVKEIDCFPRWRISYPMGSATDVWWTVGARDVEGVGLELQRILLEKCIPFMDALNSISAVVAAAADPVLRRFPAELLSYAILKHLFGEPAEASQILNALLADPKAEAWHPRVSGILERLACLPQNFPCPN